MQYSRLDLAVQEMMTGAPASSSAPASGKAGESSGTTQPEMQPRDGLEPAVQKAIWCEVDGLLQKCSQGRATYQAGMLTEARLEATEKALLPIFIERTNELLSRRDQGLQKAGRRVGFGAGIGRRGKSPEPYRRKPGTTRPDLVVEETTRETAVWYLGVVRDSALERLSSGNTSTARSAGVNAALLALHGFTRCDHTPVVQPPPAPSPDVANTASLSSVDRFSAFFGSVNDALKKAASGGRASHEELNRGGMPISVSVWMSSGPRPRGCGNLSPITDVSIGGSPEEQGSSKLVLEGYTVIDVPVTASGQRLWYRRGGLQKPIRGLTVGAASLKNGADELLRKASSSPRVSGASSPQERWAMGALEDAASRAGCDLNALDLEVTSEELLCVVAFR